MDTPKHSSPTVPTAPPQATARRRINPWNLFVGSFVPNWLLRRREVSHGAKLTYARLAQYAGREGKCHPKQETLGAELGVGDRAVRYYLRELERYGLVETEQPGLARSNRYFFLEHEWMSDDGQTTTKPSAQERQEVSGLDRQGSSAPERHDSAIPFSEENQEEENHLKKQNPHTPPEGESESVHHRESLALQCEKLYEAYPRKVGKPAALRAIRRAFGQHKFEFLLERTRLYAATYNGPAQYMPHPSTWFGQSRFNDDPATWRRDALSAGKPHAKPSPPREFKQANYQQPVTNF